MRAVLQRVQLGHVSVDDEVVGEIGLGLVILVGVTHGDGVMQARKLARKAANLYEQIPPYGGGIEVESLLANNPHLDNEEVYQLLYLMHWYELIALTQAMK